jgi:hypothetical protein
MTKPMTYAVSAHETFDGISLQVYGSESFAHVLIAANPDYSHVLRFHGGERLIVPELDDETLSGLPPWKREV